MEPLSESLGRLWQLTALHLEACQWTARAAVRLALRCTAMPSLRSLAWPHVCTDAASVRALGALLPQLPQLTCLQLGTAALDTHAVVLVASILCVLTLLRELVMHVDALQRRGGAAKALGGALRALVSLERLEIRGSYTAQLRSDLVAAAESAPSLTELVWRGDEQLS